MKYLIIGIVTLFITILVTRIFIALDLFNLNTYKEEKVEVIASQEPHHRELKKIGKQTYEVFCSSCHGMNGEGNNDKAQNHTKRMAKKSIVDVINNGANNFKSVYPLGMPAALVSESDANKIAEYLVNGLMGEKPKQWNKCSTCHADDGRGIKFIAPNIREYSDELVVTVLNNGKKGVIGTMPNFSHKLSELQMRALATHIRSIQK